MKYGNIREEELKMRVGQDWFSPYDTTLMQWELTGCTLGTFFTLKVLVGDNFRRFWGAYQARLHSLFLALSKTFDDVHGDFPIDFGV